MEPSQMISRLQQLQSRLCELVNDLGNLTDPRIVAVSEEADKLVVELQRLRKAEAESRKRGTSQAGAILPVTKAPEELGQQSSAFFPEHS